MSQWTLRTTRAFWSVTKRLNNPRHPIGHPEDTPRSGICAQSGFWARRNLTPKRAASTSRALRVRTPLPSVADPPPPHLPPEMTRTEYVTVCVCMTGDLAATWGRSRGLMNPYLQEQWVDPKQTAPGEQSTQCPPPNPESADRSSAHAYTPQPHMDRKRTARLRSRGDPDASVL